MDRLKKRKKKLKNLATKHTIIVLVRYSNVTDRCDTQGLNLGQLADLEARSAHFEQSLADLYIVVYVDFDKDSYSAYRGLREDTPQVRSAWATALYKRPDATHNRMAMQAYADLSGLNFTPALGALSKTLKCSVMNLFSLAKKDKPVPHYIHSIHAATLAREQTQTPNNPL